MVSLHGVITCMGLFIAEKLARRVLLLQVSDLYSKSVNVSPWKPIALLVGEKENRDQTRSL